MNKKIKNKKILILDDIHWHYIYKKLNKYNKNYSFYVRWNTIEPTNYFKYILKQKPEVIIMKSWYLINNFKSSPKWISLIEKIVSFYWQNKESYNSYFFWLLKTNKHNELNLDKFKTKIIFLCDMGKYAALKFPILQKFKNIHFVPDKDINKIINIIEK